MQNQATENNFATPINGKNPMMAPRAGIQARARGSREDHLSDTRPPRNDERAPPIWQRPENSGKIKKTKIAKHPK